MKKLLVLLLAIGMCASLAACGGSQSADNKAENNTHENKTEEMKEPETLPELDLNYYEEYGTLPTVDSIANANYSGKTSTLTGDNTGLVVYKYVGKDELDTTELINSYVEAINGIGFMTEGAADTEISIIENETIIAAITNTNGTMELTIIPENLRMSSKVETISIGDVITTNDYELTLNNIDFTYELLPKNTSSVYRSYPAESGKVYIHVDADVKNTMQRNIRIEELFTASALYDGKYQYNGFTIVDDDNSFEWVGSYSAATPLETCGAHSLIACPVEVETSGKPVTISLLIGKTTYEYTLR